VLDGGGVVRSADGLCVFGWAGMDRKPNYRRNPAQAKSTHSAFSQSGFGFAEC